jgi:hypothetical protein
LEDWTSKFVVAAPEFLDKHNITPWHLKSKDGVNLTPNEFISTLNTMGDKERND